ncbi:MAG: hypothetical protein NVS2B8_21690 [Vulcanimicrobiaceae bacterium]
MAYHVVKRVGQRAYRYRVESYRDPHTHETRARWTYLGRVDGSVDARDAVGEAAQAVVRRVPGRTRDALIEAFGRVAAERPYAEITAGVVAEAAGLAHGTFYRHFRDKRAILLAAVDRLRADLERDRPTFDAPYGSRDAERRRVRAWTQALAATGSARGLLRAWLDALDGDASLADLRKTRLRERTAALEAYLVGLAAAAIIVLERPAPLATALTLLVDAAFRSIVAGDPVDDATVFAGVTDAFDRAIFTTSSPVVSATDTRDDPASPK